MGRQGETYESLDSCLWCLAEEGYKAAILRACVPLLHFYPSVCILILTFILLDAPRWALDYSECLCNGQATIAVSRGVTIAYTLFAITGFVMLRFFPIHVILAHFDLFRG